MTSSTRNSKLLKEFTKYCQAHPSERFWQALRNWAGISFLLRANHLHFPVDPVTRRATGGAVYQELTDTFYWENRNDFEEHTPKV